MIEPAQMLYESWAEQVRLTQRPGPLDWNSLAPGVRTQWRGIARSFLVKMGLT